MKWLIVISSVAVSLIFLAILMFKRNNYTRQYSLGTTQSILYDWNTEQKIKVKERLIKLLNLQAEQASSVADCVITRFIENEYNYDQITELLLRVKHGGELSKDVWNVLSECIIGGFAPYDPQIGKVNFTQYKGRRIPNLLIQHILGP